MGGIKGLAFSQAAIDVLGERRRQILQEGWSAEHDDRYTGGELAKAAVCYAAEVPARFHWTGEPAPRIWPWDPTWWKPTERRRDLVKAGALILAEIERLDRAAANTPKADPAEEHEHA